MCSMKTMIKIALGIGVLLVAGYVIFPESRGWIASFAPYLLILICPLAMMFMVRRTNTPEEKEGMGKKPSQDDK